MVIYRPHRGGLKKSLAEAKQFSSFEEMKKYLLEHYQSLLPGLTPFEIEDIVIDDEVIDDKRCGWHDTRDVCLKRLCEEDYIEMYGCPQCIGMCATNYERGNYEE